MAPSAPWGQQEGALCWEMLPLYPQGIKQRFLKSSAPLWMVRGPYKTRELFSSCRRWHSHGNHNITGLLGFLSPWGPHGFPTAPGSGGLQGGLPGPHTPSLCRQVPTADLGASPSPGTAPGAGKAGSVAKLRNKQVETCTALGT